MLPKGERGKRMAWVATAVAGGRPDTQAISLYLDLKPGHKADFEVVGRAAAAFAEACERTGLHC